MRKISFIVDGQIIKPDPNCDFSHLVPGTEEHVIACFTFSKEWSGFKKVVGFRSVLGREYPAVKLEAGDRCYIPAEALARRTFKIYVVGKKGNEKITTNKLAVKQTGGEV